MGARVPGGCGELAGFEVSEMMTALETRELFMSKWYGWEAIHEAAKRGSTSVDVDVMQKGQAECLIEKGYTLSSWNRTQGGYNSNGTTVSWITEKV